MPRKGALLVPDKLLTPTQPFLTLQSCTHSHTSSTRLLPSALSQWACHKKASAYGSKVGWTPAQSNNSNICMCVPVLKVVWIHALLCYVMSKICNTCRVIYVC